MQRHLPLSSRWFVLPILLVVFSASCGRDHTEEKAATRSADAFVRALQAASFMEDVFRPDTVILQSNEEHPLGNVRWVSREPSGGYVVVCSGGAMGLYHFDSSGRFLGLIGSRGEGPGEYGSVRCVQIDSIGRIYALDYGLRRITVYGPDGHFLSSFEVRLGGSDPAAGFVLDDCGRVALHLLSSHVYGDSTIHVYSPHGELIRKFGHATEEFRECVRRFPLSMWGPQLAFARGRYYEGEYVDHRIRVYTRNGRLVDTFGEPPLSWKSFADADFSGLPRGGGMVTPSVKKVWDRFIEEEMERCVTPWYLHRLGRSLLVRWLVYGKKNRPDGAWLRFMFYDLDGNTLKNALTFRFLTRRRPEHVVPGDFVCGDRYGIYLVEYPEDAPTGVRLICWVPKVPVS